MSCHYCPCEGQLESWSWSQTTSRWRPFQYFNVSMFTMHTSQFGVSFERFIRFLGAHLNVEIFLHFYVFANRTTLLPPPLIHTHNWAIFYPQQEVFKLELDICHDTPSVIFILLTRVPASSAPYLWSQTASLINLPNSQRSKALQPYSLPSAT